jgi:uncharacterized protein YkwD
MTKRKYTHTIVLSIVATAALWFFSVSAVAANSFPSTYRVLISHEENQILLVGNSDSSGLRTLIDLDNRFRFLHTEQVRRDGINYLVVAHTNKKRRKVFLKLYHPAGTRIASKRVLRTGSQRRFSTISLDEVNGEMRVRAVKQTNRGKTQRFHVRRFRVRPFKQKKFRRTVKKNKRVRRPSGDKTGKKATRKLLNFYRKRAGLMPVKMRSGLSRACNRHITYMEAHGLTHVQDSSHAEYTPSGAAAGLASDLAFGTRNMREAFELWLEGPYHRFPIFEPSLTHIGMGYDADSRYSCLHLGTTDSSLQSFRYRPIQYPSPGVKRVETTFAEGEFPDPIAVHGGSYPAGQVVSLQFRSDVDVERMNVTLTSDSGDSVSGFTQLPGDAGDPNTANQGNAVTFLPRNPLESSTRYTVRMSGRVDGSSFSRRWKFTTE